MMITKIFFSQNILCIKRKTTTTSYIYQCCSHDKEIYLTYFITYIQKPKDIFHKIYVELENKDSMT